MKRLLAKPLRVEDDLADLIARDANMRSPVSSSGWRSVKLGILIGWIPVGIAIGLACARRRHRPSSA